MFTLERQQDIMNFLKTKKAISVAELSKVFYTSEATIRRDLEKLERMGLVRRTHGRVILIDGLDTEIPLMVRETEQHDEKQFIGLLAANHVNEGDSIIMDSSSTVWYIVPHLKSVKDLTVITNGAKTAIDLGTNLHIRVLSTGGWLRENSLSYIGETSLRSIFEHHVHTLFFSCRAVSMEFGLSDANEGEAELRKMMIKHSNRVILLCDNSKLDKTSFCRICSFDEIDCMITDKAPSSQWVSFLNDKNVELIYKNSR